MIRQLHLIRSTIALAVALTASLAPAAWADPGGLVNAVPTSAADSQSNMAIRPNPDQQTATVTANTGPCSEVCSGGAGSYGPVSQDGRTLGPPALHSATASQLPDIHRQQTAASHAFAYKPTQPARYTSAGLNGYVNSPTNGTPAIVHVTTHSDPFDWGDAAIGAAGGLVISLLMVGGVVIITHRRQTQTRRVKALAG